jgi:formate dehydrogenase major subunit
VLNRGRLAANRRQSMSLSRRDFLKFGTTSAAGVAVAGGGLDLAPVQAAATDLKIKEAKVVASVCPYCAVGCGQLIFSKGDKIIDIEGHPDTPHTLGRLCPKGAATIQLSNNPLRPTKALYRAPGSDTWEPKPLEWMYEQIAKRYYDTREKHFIEKEKNKDGKDVVVNRLEAIASLGSACIDNEECYLLSKLNRTLGIVYHEHQARV